MNYTIEIYQDGQTKKHWVYERPFNNAKNFFTEHTTGFLEIRNAANKQEAISVALQELAERLNQCTV